MNARWRAVFGAFGLALCFELAAQATTREDYFERAREHYERRRFLNTLHSLRIVLQMSEGNDARSDKIKLDAEVLAAESLRELGRNEEAANMYERSLEHGFNEKRVFAFLALYYEKRGKFAEALPHFEKYYALDKSDVQVHIRYAAALGRLKRREASRQVLENSEPKPAGETQEKCDLLERQKKNQAALLCFRALRDAQPDREANYLALYRLALLVKNHAEAKENAEYLYHIFGAEPRYIWPLAEVKLSERKFYDARLLLEEVIRLQGANADAERLLANLKVQAGSAMDKPYRASPKEMRMLGK
jgi:tetratricopeptide (TPR) repeat protein